MIDYVLKYLGEDRMFFGTDSSYYQGVGTILASKLNEEQKREILKLATDFPKLWKDPGTSHKEKKRIVRLLIEDVTLIRDKKITVHIRFKGGAKETLNLPIPLSHFMEKKTKPEIVKQVDKMLNKYTYKQISSIFNGKGIKTSLLLKATKR